MITAPQGIRILALFLGIAVSTGISGALATSFSEQGDSSQTAGAATSYGAAWGDFNGDGNLDLYVPAFGAANRLYMNNGDGTFTDIGAASGTDDASNTWGATWGDYDNDGRLDLFVANSGTCRLYRNNGDGTFTDMASAAGIAGSGDNRCGIWGDYDNDGHIDLYVARAGAANRLYRNNGDGTFSDQGAASGTDDGNSGISAAWGDYDNDGYLDLYVANTIGINRLYHNDGDGTFSEVGASSGTDDGGDARSAAWGDYDNDGFLDLYVSSVGPNRMFHNDGDGTFTDATVSSGTSDASFSTGTAWGDYDNDGDLDLYVVRYSTANEMFENNGDGTFATAGDTTGTDDGLYGQGAAWGDYDNDGDLDLYLARNNMQPNRLYRNDGAAPASNHWLQVDLIGNPSNKAGIGVLIRCVSTSGTLERQPTGGSGLASQNEITAAFGLGSATTVDTVQVLWSTGKVTTLTGIAADQRIAIEEPLARFYIDSNAMGAGNGSSWDDAYTDLQSALTIAQTGDEIWVAAGTYTPTSGTDRSATFALLSTVALYGGFAGTETTIDERNVSANPTILSGDIGVPADSTDNVYHVLSLTGADTSTVVDGFTITGGRADGAGTDGTGGGMHNDGGSPRVADVVFTRNSAVSGGGVANRNSGGGTFHNVSFTMNSATDGGALHNDGMSSPALIDVVMTGNEAVNGGAIYNDNASDPVLVNVVVFNNHASSNGGGMVNTGSSAPDITNSTFTRNTATGSGGGMYNDSSSPVLINTILAGDTATGSGNEISNSGGSSPAFSHSLVAGSGGSGAWDPAFGTDSGGNVDGDPLFADGPGGDLHLLLGSTAIDAGTNAAPNLPSADLDGNPRINGVSVDMGVYEYEHFATQLVLPADLEIAWSRQNPTTCDTVYVINTGTASMDILSISGCSGGIFSTDTGMTDFTVAPGDTSRFLVCATPIEPGMESCVVTVATTASNSPTGVAVSVDVAATTVYVDGSATGANDGTSWDDAFTELRSALDGAIVADEIWVAAGTYKPTSGSSRNETFQLKSGVRVYGGFAGVETALEERDWVANPTILSGDIGTPQDSTDNTHHVVTGTGADSTATLDGFTIVDGNADLSGTRENGAGVLIWDGSAFGPKLAHLIVVGNSAKYGGGLYNRSSQITLSDVAFIANTTVYDGAGAYNYTGTIIGNQITFSGNESGRDGGGLYNHGTATLNDATFSANYAGSSSGGGGLRNHTGTSTLTDVTFSNNVTFGFGAGISSYGSNSLTITRATFAGDSSGLYGGGIHTTSPTTITDAVFAGEKAVNGGALYTVGTGHVFTNVVIFECEASIYGGGMFNSESTPILTQVTMSRNTAPSGPAIFNQRDSAPTLINSVIWDNAGPGNDIYNHLTTTTLYSHSLIDGSGGSGAWDPVFGTDLGGNIDADPLFVDAPGGDLRLSLGSPAIDGGDSTTAFLPATDLAGNPRILGATVDMGAYEFVSAAIAAAYPSPVVFAAAPAGDTTCTTVSIVNTGGVTMNIAGIVGCTGGPFSVDTTMTSHTVGPGDTTTFDVCVSPTTPDADSCEVSIVSDAANGALVIPVRLDVVTAIASGNAPQPFRIVGVMPNPFNPTTRVHFTLPAPMPVSAEIWSVRGARVRVLARNLRFAAGDNYLSWDGRNDNGSTVSSGVYFVRVRTRLGAKVARAVLLK